MERFSVSVERLTPLQNRALELPVTQRQLPMSRRLCPGPLQVLRAFRLVVYATPFCDYAGSALNSGSVENANSTTGNGYHSLSEPDKTPNVTDTEAQSPNITGNQSMTVWPNRATGYGIAVMSQARLFPVVLILMISGCAGSMGTIHADPATAPVTSFDGSYRSTLDIKSAAGEVKGSSWSVSPGQPMVTVANGQFSDTVPHPDAPGNPAPTFQAIVVQNGSFAGQDNDGTISGRITGTHMEGIIDGSACIYAFTGDRI
jgi:hypothetical protein